MRAVVNLRLEPKRLKPGRRPKRPGRANGAKDGAAQINRATRLQAVTELRQLLGHVGFEPAGRISLTVLTSKTERGC